MRRTKTQLAPLATIAAICSVSCTNMQADATGLDVIPMIQLEEQLRIGNATDPEVGFSRIGAVKVDSNGEIYVFEAADLHIRVFSDDGQRVRTIGRKGNGPGEFTTPVSIAFSGDTVIALGGRELGACKTSITLFDHDGNLLTTSAVDGVRTALHGTSVGVIRPNMPRDDGTFVGSMGCYTGGDAPGIGTVGPNDTLRIPRLLFSVLGTPIDTLGWDLRPPPAARAKVDTAYLEGRRHPVPNPPLDDPLKISLVDGDIIVDRRTPPSETEAEIRVTKLTHAGDTIFSRRHPYVPVRYTEAALDAVAASSARVPGGMYRIIDGMPQITPFADTAAAAKAIREKLAFPAFQMPVRNSFKGEDGSFWLMRENDGSEIVRWVLFTPDGKSRGRLDLPANHRPAWAMGDQVLIVEPDENDVPFLVRYRISEAADKL